MKTAIVTGGSSGIGRAAAKALAKAGYAILINYSTNEEGALATKKEIIEAGGVAEIYRADVSDAQSCSEMVAFSERTLGTTEVLVANAGKSLVKLMTDTTEDEWNALFKVNVNGVYNVARAVARGMVDRKRGRIITVSSVWGEVGASCESCYSATKAAVIGFTKALAKELAPSCVTVNCVTPGVIDTRMNDCFSEVEKQALADEIPMCRMGTPEEVASAILFFASDDASYITGEVLGVNGGYR